MQSKDTPTVAAADSSVGLRAVFFNPIVSAGIVCRSSLGVAFAQPGTIVHNRKVHASTLATLAIGASPFELSARAWLKRLI